MDQFFNFDTESAEVTSKGKYFILTVRKCSKKFRFEPVEEQSKEQFVTDWVDLLNKAIDASEGRKNNHAYLPEKMEDFYTQMHVSYQDF